MKKILIVDDEQTARKGLVFLLESDSVEIYEAENKEQAEKLLNKVEFDINIFDLRIPSEDEGIGLIESASKINPLTPILVITAYGSLDNAVRAVKSGADDFITKDFTEEEIKMKIDRLLEIRHINQENKNLAKQVNILEEKIKATIKTEPFIGESNSIKRILELVDRVSKDNNSNVLITGESGTGKELIARSIHINSPERRFKCFNVVDISNIPSTLLESHLFGHEKGAFTDATSRRIGVFESADNGTIFLDEIGDFPKQLQVKLLRFLQEGTFSRVGSNIELSVDVRIIAATNRNIEELVKNKLFREDLYYRLNVIRVHLPPLRERKEDILPLIENFQQFFEKQKGKKLFFPKDVLDKIVSYNWPGNVRQLKNFIERLFVICTKDSVTENDLYFYGLPIKNISDKIFSPLFSIPFKEARKKLIENFEKEFISHYLNLNNYNITKVAQILDESREHLSRKIKQYGLKSS